MWRCLSGYAFRPLLWVCKCCTALLAMTPPDFMCAPFSGRRERPCLPSTSPTPLLPNISAPAYLCSPISLPPHVFAARYVCCHVYLCRSLYHLYFFCCSLAACRTEGFVGFYRGWVANTIKVVPQNAIRLVAYEALKGMLGIKRAKTDT